MLLSLFILLARGSRAVGGGCSSDQWLGLLLTREVAFLAALAAVVGEVHAVLVGGTDVLLVLLLVALRLVRALSTLRSFPQNRLDVSPHLDRVLLVNVVVLLLHDLCLVQQVLLLRVLLRDRHHGRCRCLPGALLARTAATADE